LIDLTRFTSQVAIQILPGKVDGGIPDPETPEDCQHQLPHPIQPTHPMKPLRSHAHKLTATLPLIAAILPLLAVTAAAAPAEKSSFKSS
jgi:hypothetical protein